MIPLKYYHFSLTVKTLKKEKYKTLCHGALLRYVAGKKSNEARKLENNTAIIKLDSARESKLGWLTFSHDYLEREKALQRLSDSNPIIRVTTWFLILFFILVDILPVTWKGLTSKGPYDEYLNETELKIRNEVQERMLDSETHLAIHVRNKEKEKVSDDVVT